MIKKNQPSRLEWRMSQDENQLAFDFNPPLPTLQQLWTPDDIYLKCDADTIALFKEDNRVERKSAKIKQKDLADYLSMWANTQPSGGIVFIGVEDNGRISGCKGIHQNHINEIHTVGRLCPDARFEFKNVAVKNTKDEDDFVIVLRVHYRAEKLVETVDGNAYVREGDEKRSLTETEKREIRLNKGELDVESERVPLRYPDDFNISLLNDFKNLFIQKRQLTRPYNIEEVLHLSKLGKPSPSGFQPNLACALLFAKDAREVVPGAFIRVLRYDGVEEKFGRNLNSVADRIFDGPLAIQLKNAENFIETQIRNFTRLGEDGRFVTNPEYPKEVWLEALVNAVVHRSYNLKQMNIFVKMFDDKIVVESPGAFLPPTTESTVYEAHNPRNPNLMWGLFYFDFVQCAFEGTRRMREGMREARLPDPRFKQRQSGTFQVSVTLENDVQHRKQFVRTEAVSAINPDLYAELSESEKMIVNYLAERLKVNVTDAGLVIARDWKDTKGILDGLVAKGILARSDGKTRSRHRFYYLKGRLNNWL
ncbi:RNA-binding domain-containing protein [Agrobacterium tumefaciens]|uniref:RNA-binding domain-containing protein n=1 Tax=Agrobacterium tumefaciens TaxID=358 RepID=UPI000DD5541A|nr:RNA-binding domain-containing protein [Agrobacterium tumefaciens]